MHTEDMRKISQTAAAVLNALTEGLTDPCEAEDGSARKIENSGGTHMAVYVWRLGPNTYSVGHYFTQNGDRCPDPMMEFIKIGDDWYPTSIEQMGFRGMEYRRACELQMGSDGNYAIKGIYRRELGDQCTFVTTWMRNIKQQQGIKTKAPKRSKRITVKSLEREAEKKFLAWQDAVARLFIEAEGRTANGFRELAEWADKNGHSLLKGEGVGAC